MTEPKVPSQDLGRAQLDGGLVTICKARISYDEDDLPDRFDSMTFPFSRILAIDIRGVTGIIRVFSRLADTENEDILCDKSQAESILEAWRAWYAKMQ